MSQHDYLTKLYNRFHFEQEFDRLNVERQHPISFVMCDVNGLKLVNDVFGHLEGDKLLQEAATIIKKAVRGEDIVARWGGDEFAILLPQTSHEDAQKVINRILDLTEKAYYQNVKPSIAVGLATKEKETDLIQDTLNTAEEEMYKNKSIIGPVFRMNIADQLLGTLEEKQSYQKPHKEAMSKLIHKYANYYKLAPALKKELLLMNRYHDVGLCVFSEEFLNKETEFTVEEQERYNSHYEVSGRLLSAIPQLRHIASPVAQMLERVDGNGPLKIKGTDLKKNTKLFNVIHRYEFITSERPNKPRKSHRQAISILRQESGSILDKDLVNNFISIFDED